MFSLHRLVSQAMRTHSLADIAPEQVKLTGKGKEAQYEILTDVELKRLISEMQ